MGRQGPTPGRVDRPPGRPARFIGKTTWHTEPIGKLKTDRVAIIEGVEPTPT